MIAVLDFEGVGASKVQASALTDRMREELLNTGKYLLVDRSQLNAVLDEQALQQTGCTSQECAVRVGKILGVRKLVTGRVSKLDDKLWLLSAQIIEVESARTLRAVSQQQQGDFGEVLDKGLSQLAAKLTAQPGTVGLAVSTCGPAPTSPNVWREPLTCMEFVRVPAGEFVEGCYPGATGCDDDELPGRRVRISEVWMSKTEVTQGQWTRLIGNNPSAFPKAPDYPVENVSWDDAQQYIRLLNSRSGAVLFRLPTEAEWEYASRAGGKAYTHGTQTGLFDPKLAKVNSSDSTAPVASFPPNELGLYDMSGNVSEWVQDTYDESAYASGPETNPVTEGVGPRRVLRGGSWYSNRKISRCTDRNKDTPTFRGNRVGFRVAKSP
jgi:formylglycine-generating enzyme required for sulfatase activity